MNGSASQANQKPPATGEARVGEASRGRAPTAATAALSFRANSSRFTLDGSADLERRLSELCQTVQREVSALIPAGRLDGLLLAGGYGRGEGGVLRTPAGDAPYNDLEFYVFLRGNAVLAERKYRDPLHDLGHRLSPDAGLEVEFKVLTLDKLRSARPSMFYYDLVAGHRWFLGDDALLAGCQHHLQPREIPLHEGTRLLMNRGSGLLFSAERLRREQFGPEEADFVGRNLAKLQLALGDALLAARGLYHWSCRERHQRLLTYTGWPDASWREPVCRHHAEGVEFKLHPVNTAATREQLGPRHAELTHLAGEIWRWLENERLGTRFASASEYALGAQDKCPETAGWRNRLVNARAFGASCGLKDWAARYPRQRLFHALCLLLWNERTLEDPGLLARAQWELRTEHRTFAELVAAYERLWARFN